MKLRRFTRVLFHFIGILLYPGICPFCGDVSTDPFSEQDGICPSCRQTIRTIGDPYCLKCGKPLEDAGDEYCPDCEKTHHSFDQGRALYVHEGPVKDAVYQLKYGGRRVYGEIFGEELALQFGSWIAARHIDLIIPIPLHRKRYRERGYNQASVIAHALADKCRIVCRDDLLVRPSKTRRLKTMGRDKRKDALRGAFRTEFRTDPDRQKPNILLVDDIYTTGSTIDEAARTLKAAGAGKVYFLTFTIGRGQ